MRFKKLKGVTKDMKETIFYDLECLELKHTEDNDYHYKLLVENLKDIFGVK